MTKSIENIPACNELNPLATDLIGKLNTSKFVSGGMPPAKVSLRLSTHLVGLEVQILFQVFIFIHTLCILVTKANASLHRLALVFVGRKCNTYPQNICAGSNIAYTARDICVQFSFI